MPKFAAVLCKTRIVNTGFARLSSIFCSACRISVLPKFSFCSAQGENPYGFPRFFASTAEFSTSTAEFSASTAEKHSLGW